MSDQPNVLWICTDQQRFDSLAMTGASAIETPNIDGIAASGVHMERTYCQSPICTPSRSSFLTGRYPSAIGANYNGNARFSGDVPLLPARFRDAGYRCGLIGKLHLAHPYDGRPEARVDDGYELFRYSHAPRNDMMEGHDYADWIAAKGYDPADVLSGERPVSSELHQTRWCAEEAAGFIAGSKDHPWFLSINFYDPHAPFNPPPEYEALVDPHQLKRPVIHADDEELTGALDDVEFVSPAAPLDRLAFKDTAHMGSQISLVDYETLAIRYLAMIRQIDDRIGDILQALRQSGQWDSTIILFCSDHGEMAGDHGLVTKGCRFYEGLTRVPLILSWPAKIPAGQQYPGLTELSDIFPTLLDLCGLPEVPGVTGESFASQITDRADMSSHRHFVRSEYYNAVPKLGNHLGVSHRIATMHVQDGWKLIVFHGRVQGQLFNLSDDPGEHRNRWGDPECQSVKFDLMKASFDLTVDSCLVERNLKISL